MPKLFLELSDIQISFGDRILLQIVKAQIHQGDRIGLTGENGSGKTTLMKILAGALSPDSGMVRRFCPVAYIPQLDAPPPGADIRRLKEWGVHQSDPSFCSGGEALRRKLAAALGAKAPLLLADEPTANLDLPGIGQLETELHKYDTLVLISHDRSLLNGLCNIIWELRDGRLSVFSGDYTFYENQQLILSQQREEAFSAYTAEKEHLEKTVYGLQNKARTMKKAPARMGNSEARLHKGRTRQQQGKLQYAAGKLQDRLERLEAPEKPEMPGAVQLDFSLIKPPGSRVLFTGSDFTFAYGQRILFQDASFSIKNRTRTALTGPNGAGKTTLLKLLAFDHERIYRTPGARAGFLRQGFEQLELQKTALENVLSTAVQSQTAVRTVMARLLFKQEDLQKQAGLLSGGERVKLAFAKLLVSDANVLLLDEPTNYLDLPAQKALTALLREYQGAVVFVSHDRTFMDGVAQELLVIKDRKLVSFQGNYSQYPEHSGSLENDEKAVLELRLAGVISSLSGPLSPIEKEKAESEYAELLQRLKGL